jgi:hypothetical protein
MMPRDGDPAWFRLLAGFLSPTYSCKLRQVAHFEPHGQPSSGCPARACTAAAPIAGKDCASARQVRGSPSRNSRSQSLFAKSPLGALSQRLFGSRSPCYCCQWMKTRHGISKKVKKQSNVLRQNESTPHAPNKGHKVRILPGSDLQVTLRCSLVSPGGKTERHGLFSVLDPPAPSTRD